MERQIDNADIEVPLGSIFDTRTGNEWREDTKRKPQPGKLLGEMWFEGEIALLLADHGMGKSILGAQIGESIARGKAFEPFEMTAKPQPVVLLDLEMSGRQFTMRYIGDADEDDKTEDYEFADGFHRTEVDPYAPIPKECRNYSDYLCRAAGRLCREKGAKVLIVDGISQLKHSNDASRDLLPLMKGLDRLRRDHGVAILVLAPARNRILARSIAIRTLMGANLLCERADSVIAVGPSEYSVKHRYIKHLRSKGSEIVFDQTNVPAFRLEKIDGNFLGFVFEGFSPESDHFEPRREPYDRAMIDRIKEMHDDGMTYREIAAEVGLSKSTVHKMHQKWRPEMSSRVAEPFDPTTHEFYFPGCEEYDEAGRDPRFNCLYDDESVENYRLRREAYLIETARAKARKEYKKTGKAPKLAEMLERMAAAGGNGSEPPASAGGMNSISDSTPGVVPNEDIASAATPPAHAGGSDKTSGLKRSLDAYGNEIFIEKEDERGKPIIWYNYDSKGRKLRMARKGNTVIIERVDEPPKKKTRTPQKVSEKDGRK